MASCWTTDGRRDGGCCLTLMGLGAVAMCTATTHSFGWIFNSCKWAEAGLTQPCGLNPSWVWAVWALVWIFLPFLLGNQTQNCRFCTTAAFFACIQRAVVLRLHIHMYSSAYVYIYTYGVVYIFCIDIQIGLVLSKFTSVLCSQCYPPCPDHIPVLCFSAAFSHLRSGHFYSFGSCSVTDFVHVLLYSRCFLCFLLPVAWDLHHSVSRLQHVNFSFNFDVQNAMKVFLFSPNQYLLVTSLFLLCSWFPLSPPPTPRRYIIFLDES